MNVQGISQRGVHSWKFTFLKQGTASFLNQLFSVFFGSQLCCLALESLRYSHKSFSVLILNAEIDTPFCAAEARSRTSVLGCDKAHVILEVPMLLQIINKPVVTVLAT